MFHWGMAAHSSRKEFWSWTTFSGTGTQARTGLSRYPSIQLEVYQARMQARGMCSHDLALGSLSQLTALTGVPQDEGLHLHVSISPDPVYKCDNPNSSRLSSSTHNPPRVFKSLVGDALLTAQASGLLTTQFSSNHLIYIYTNHSARQKNNNPTFKMFISTACCFLFFRVSFVAQYTLGTFDSS